MATRKGKTVADKPPAHRRTQRAAGKKLVTMRSISEMRREMAAPQVRAGRVLASQHSVTGTLNQAGRISGTDYNPLFDGKAGLSIYDQMDRSDGQVGAAGDLVKLPLRAARYRAVPPDNPTAKEKQIAEAVNRALFENGDWPAGEGWDMYLRHILMRVTHGFGLLEMIWMFDEDLGVYRWKKLSPILPTTVDKFHVDRLGMLGDIEQYAAEPGTASYDYKRIPAGYYVLSVREREGGNFFGKSVYRRLYKHWFYKDEAYRINGVKLDRYGVGIPVAKIGEDHVLEADELQEIELTLMAMRSHDRAYIIEPPKVDFRIMVPDGEGGASGLMETVGHHDTMILRGVLATFMSDHSEGLNTNRTRTLADFFLHAERAEANAVTGDILSYMVRPFCTYNFNMIDARPPVIEVQGIGDLTAEMFAANLAPLVQAGLVTPDDPVEDILRKIFGLPPLLEGYKRGETKPAPPALPAAGGGNPTNPAPDRQEEDEPPDARELNALPADGPLIHFWTQPRSKDGKFSHGRKSGAAGGTPVQGKLGFREANRGIGPGTTKQAGGPEVGRFREGGIESTQNEIARRTLEGGSQVGYDEKIEGSINDVKIVELEGEDGTRVKAIFKPESGESWTNGDAIRKQAREEGIDLDDQDVEDWGDGDDDSPIRETITNRDFTYAQREAAAYDVDRALGTNVVPPTVWRDLDGDTGMAQAFIDKADWPDYAGADTDSAYGMAVLDVAVGNTDRHSGNILQDKKKRWVAIDQGLTFPNDDMEFRPDATMNLFEHVGRKPMSPAFVERVRKGLNDTDWDKVLDPKKVGGIDRDERNAFKARIEKLKEAFDPEVYSSPSVGLREVLFNMAKESTISAPPRRILLDVDED